MRRRVRRIRPSVCQLKAVENNVVRTKCGESWKKPPAGFGQASGWSSQVTCTECLQPQ